LIQFVIASKPIQEVIPELTPKQQSTLLRQCQGDQTSNAEKLEDITWQHRCRDVIAPRFKLSLDYNWMAEFRSNWIWRQLELEKYKSMLWFDADSFAMVPWHQETIKYFISVDRIVQCTQDICQFGRSKQNC